MNPYIVSRPANEIQVQKLGDTVRLNCSAGSSPLPKIIWLTDGRIIHSLVEHGGIDLTESELTINPLHTIGAPSSTRKPIDILRSENIIYDKRDDCFIIDITLNTI